ncbi:MAG: hypothetical protein NC489_11520 [Ruminococcus flavefaciens]|nr:hypothetical protein [Ruminococcus flavefaciens]
MSFIPDGNSTPNTGLTQFYDDLKGGMSKDVPSGPNLMRVTPGMGHHMSNHPGAVAWRNMAAHHCDHLKDDCRKHILLDIYCKILPLDDDYKCKHHGQMAGDIDAMLANKGCTASQYLTSAYESTHAPLLEFVLRSTNKIGELYMEAANDKLKDAQEKDIELPPPEAPTVDDEDVSNQLVDVKKDTEYENFLDKLKEKTVNKIVADVSKIIAGKKEEKEMTFTTSSPSDKEASMESAVSVGVDYIQKRLMQENVDHLTEAAQDDVIGMAIREATLNELDIVFDLPGSSFREFATRVRMGRGSIITESAITGILEDGTQRYEPLYKETDGEKYDVANYEKIGKDGQKTKMSDQEAKKVLDPDSYKKYQDSTHSN